MIPNTNLIANIFACTFIRIIELFKQRLLLLHSGTASFQVPLLQVSDEAPYNLYLEKIPSGHVTFTTVPCDVALVESVPSLTDRTGHSEINRQIIK